MLRRCLLLGVAIAPVTACSAPVAMGESNKDPAYQRKLDRVLVTVAFRSRLLDDKQNATFMRAQELKQSFAAKWAPLGVSVETLDLDSASDPAKALADAIASFGPTQVMELKVTTWNTKSSLVITVVDGYAVDVSILDPGTKKRVWRATVDFGEASRSGRLRRNLDGSDRSHQSDADDFVDVLTIKLKAEGLLR